MKTGYSTDYNITNCEDQMRANNRYFLTQDITDTLPGSYICFQVYSTETNVTLDCQGHTVDGTDTSGSYGFYETGTQTNVTIKNCVFSDWDDGLRTSTVDDFIINNVTAFSNLNYGIRIGNIGLNENVHITNSESYNNTIGIGITDSSNKRYYYDISIEDSFVYNNTYGLRLNVYDGIFVSGNTIIDNDYSVRLDSQSGAWGYNFPKIYNNYFSSNLEDVYINTIYRNDFYNPNDTDFPQSESELNCSRTNIIGQSCYGGNYWTNPTSTGYSDNCTDTTPEDGVCDNAYIINSTYTIEDGYPITETTTSTTSTSTTTIPETTTIEVIQEIITYQCDGDLLVKNVSTYNDTINGTATYNNNLNATFCEYGCDTYFDRARCKPETFVLWFVFIAVLLITVAIIKYIIKHNLYD
jgi:hypothetical protein